MEKGLLNQLTEERQLLLEAMAKKEFSNLTGKKIIIIDDSKDSLTLMSTYLGKVSDIDVNTYTDEFDALRKITYDKPDLIILDVMLSYTDGMKLGSLLKELQLYEGHILFISSNKQYQQDLEVEFGRGAFHFLPKPFDKNLFVEKVMSLLRRNN